MKQVRKPNQLRPLVASCLVAEEQFQPGSLRGHGITVIEPLYYIFPASMCRRLIVFVFPTFGSIAQSRMYVMCIRFLSTGAC